MKLRVLIPVLAMLLAGGCSTGPVVAPTSGQPESAATGAYAHQLALEHVIDGSVYEMKGEYAKAILEYQDALRYEKNDAIYYALARDYSRLGKHALAIEFGKEAIRLNPERVEYRESLAEAYEVAGEFDSAAAQYEVAVSRDSGDIRSFFNLARMYQAHKPLKALDVYEGMVQRFGPIWDVLFQIADLSNKLGKLDQSINALAQMVHLDPGNQELVRTLGQTYLRAGKQDSALKIFQDLRLRSPDNLDYRADLAGVYLEKKEYAKAAENFRPILADDSVAIESKLRIGELYFNQIDKDSTLAPIADSIFQRIRDGAPADWRPYWFLGAIASITHNDSVAIENFSKVTSLASWNADGWVYLASVYLGQNRYADGARTLEAALRVLPDDFRVNFFLGVAYSRLNRNEDAVRVLEHARVLNPKDVDAVAQLALIYDGMKDYAKSDSLYELAIGMAPDNDLVLNNYGYSLAERGLQLDRALEMAKKAVQAKPHNSSYLDTMGWIYFRLGNFSDAEKYVRQAVTEGEASAVVHEHLGDIYFKLNKKQEALEQWNAALKLDENNAGLKSKISRGTL